MRKGKAKVGGEIATWHKEIKDQGGGFTRFLSAALTFGASEVLVGGIIAVGGTANNISIENQISQIAKCIDDLRYDP